MIETSTRTLTIWAGGILAARITFVLRVDCADDAPANVPAFAGRTLTQGPRIHLAGWVGEVHPIKPNPQPIGCSALPALENHAYTVH